MTTPGWIAAGALGLLFPAAFLLWTPDQPLASLERRYLGSPGEMISVSGIRLHVRDTGPRGAPALILIHGFGSSLQTWDAWSALLDRDYRVIRFDLPGCGLSGADPAGDYSDARSVEVLSALLNELGLARATLIGNSIGGRLAWRFAARFPERVSALVLISPDGFASPGFAYGKAPEVPRVLGLMRYVLPKFLLRMNLKPAYADPSRLTPATVDRYYDLMLAPGVRAALLDRMRTTVLVDPVPLLGRITAPTLLLWGDKDALIPISNAADYLRAMPGARLVTLPGLGHVPFEEDPGGSIAPLREFLAGSR